MESIGILIQARTGSTRLPNKVLLPFDGENAILDIIISKLINAGWKEKIVVVTSKESGDDPIVDCANNHGVRSFRGSENNVLSRFCEATAAFGFDGVIRICADNPLLDMESIAYLIRETSTDLDYLSFRMNNGRPIILNHIGIFAEYVSRRALDKAIQLTDDKLYLEHVTNYVYGNPEVFEVRLDNAPEEVYNRPEIRLTCDSEEDFKMLQEIYSQLKLTKNGDISELISLIDTNPKWMEVMKAQIERYEK